MTLRSARRPGRDQAPVGEAEEFGVAARLAVDDVRQGQGRSAPAIARPVGQLIGRVHRVEDRAHVRPAVGESDHRGLVQLQFAQAIEGVG